MKRRYQREYWMSIVINLGSSFETKPFTTRAELEAHRNGIEVEKLPNTFSHAIAVARTMSIQYLWIDALWSVSYFAFAKI
jgi:hypothetical protein